METTNRLIATSAAAGNSSCHGASQGSGTWFSRRRGLVLGGGAIIAGVVLALSQHWLAVAELVPLLYVLPCALMMLMCMKSMNHGQQTGGAQTPTSADRPTGTDVTHG
jgi:hypothetical protein